MKKAKVTMALVLSAAAALSAGCGSTGSASGSSGATSSETASQAASGTEQMTSSTSDPKTLTAVIYSDITGFDPTQAYDGYTNLVVNQITESLLSFDNDNKLVCDLAKSWKQKDDTTYVYEVRDDIKFSDGNPMTMDDVLFSINRNMDPSVASLLGWMYDSVDSIEQTGDWELTVKLKNPDATWQYTFATTGGQIIEKAAYEKDKSIVGTNAYKYESRTNGSQVVLTKNDNYSTFDDPVYFDKIVYNIITEDTTRVQAFTSGQADFGMNPPLDMLDQLESADNVTVDMFDTFGMDFLAFNTCREPFNDPNVRKAVACALDVDSIYSSLLSKYCSQSTQLPFSSVLYDTVGTSEEWEDYAKDYNKYKYDLDAAKKYLAQSNYPDGFTCDLVVNDTSLQNSEALYIQAALQELGITVNINKMTDNDATNIQFGSTWDSSNNCRDYDMGIFTWYADYPDISGNLVPVYLSDNAAAGGSNTSGYSNAEVDEYLREQLAESDPEKRAELMKKALDIIGEDIPMLILDYPKQGAMYSNTLQNVNVSASYVWNTYFRTMSRAE